MNRVFFSLYLIIVLSVVVIGWSLDRLWQMANPIPAVSPYENTLFKLLEKEINQKNINNFSEETLTAGKPYLIDLGILFLDDFSKTLLSKKIEDGGIVTIFDDEGKKTSYKKITDTQKVIYIKWSGKNPNAKNSYIAFIVLFYLAMAIMIYFWILPLSKDLRKLEHQTKHVGKDGVPNKVMLGQRSAVFHLASAFNAMSERIRQLIASHKEMTYAVSHELRTPLARMKFALEMAMDNQDLQYTRKQLSGMKIDVSEMDELINQLLTYAGFEQGDQTLDLKPGDLYALVNGMVANNRSNNILRDSSTLEVDIVNQLPTKEVYCEWYLMERCVHNLLQNGFRYAKNNISISLALENADYVICVEDDGPGIPSEDREKVFKPFVRLIDKSRSNTSGFGLGLSIVHRIIHWHGGTVTVERSDLGGAKFILRWPKPFTHEEHT